MPAFDDKKILHGVESILTGLGLSLTDPNLIDTPKRVLKMYKQVFSSLLTDSIDELFVSSFPSNYSGIVMVSNIKCHSFCPHHLLPIEYSVNVGYISNKQMLGISKLARVVEAFAHKPELQETFTENIAKCIEKNLGASGVMVVVHGQHGCMRIRGVEQIDSVTTTSSVKGAFMDSPAARAEFLTLSKLSN